jgi:UDP-N-acetylmuramyl pentapeptide phosphotransferase/UDP-N-acetylglucosamine-1-phosphate transferase
MHAVVKPRGAGAVLVLVTLSGWLIIWKNGLVTEKGFVVFIVCAAVIALMGFVDDIFGLSVRVKASLQMLSCLIALFAHQANMPYMAILCGAIWCFGVMNYYNFMDGIDGMASSFALSASVVIFLVGLLQASPLCQWSGILIGASSIGILCFNWFPSKIFLGDVGSLFLGFVFSYLGIVLALRSYENIALSLSILFPFLFDCTLTLCRRIKSKQNILMAHREHLYQRLVIGGYSHPQMTLLYVSLSLGASLVWLLTHQALVLVGTLSAAACLLVAMERFVHENP